MILGFISLLLTFGQNYITQICISEKIAKTMLPCKNGHKMKGARSEGGIDGHGEHNISEGHHRRLLLQMIMNLTSNRRVLSAGGGDTSCHPVSRPSKTVAHALGNMTIMQRLLCTRQYFINTCLL